MALADTLGVEEMTQVGKLSDAQIAMTNGDLETDLASDFNTAMSAKGLEVKTGETLAIAYNRALGKWKVSVLTQAA